MLKKILLICSTSASIIGFRKALIEKLQGEDYEVSAIAFDDKNREEIEKRGINFYSVKDKNRSVNPFKILTLKSRLCKKIKEIAPDIVFTFMLKPNAFGVLAAKKAGVKKIYSMVEGAGDVFINNGLKWKIIRSVVCCLYRKAFKYAKKVFFLNEDDKNEFVARKLVTLDKTEIVHGIGVDLNSFEFKPVKNYRKFLMIARMLKTKGVMEYCEAAKKAKALYPDAVFGYLGAESTLKIADIQPYIDDGSIEYYGTTKDVRPFIEDCSVNVLPSYREGLGLVNAEAGAIGRPSITCNTIGTKDTVMDGYNGFLVDIKSSDALVEKMIYFIENPQAVDEMGKNARAFAEETFDKDKITAKVLEIIKQD